MGLLLEGADVNVPIIVKPAVRRNFDAFMGQGRVFFLSAPCGFGKTALANELLAEHGAVRLSAADSSFVLPSPAECDSGNILLIDDLQSIQEEACLLALAELVRSTSQGRFILLSRGAVPGCLKAFQYAGLMTVLEADDLLLDHDDVRKLLLAYSIQASESEIAAIVEKSIGYPLAVAITAQLMSDGSPYTPDVVERAYREVFAYFDAAVYRRFDLPVRRFLLELAPFEQFDVEMARMVSGDPRAAELLAWLQRNTTMLRYDDRKSFHFWPEFRSFLLWEMSLEYSDERRRALLARGGMCYELKEDYSRALECYSAAGDHSKVSEILIFNAELHPGMGHYAEMEKYYRALPESEILASPSLMQAMSMLSALACDYAESERWYQELCAYAARCGKHDAAGKQARSRLAWLDISLPQRGVEGLTETIPAVFRLMTNKEVALPSFSVTSALPSIMNGGKDFSAWSKIDDLLYRTIRIPVEAILGRDGVCLPDAAVAESKFEKGEDISARMLALVPRLSEVRANGTPDIEFAINGLLARSQLACGNANDARHTVVSLRDQFSERGLIRFLPNIDALLCRIDLQAGSLAAAEAWYREKAPRNPAHLNVMQRYQYLTQAMVELAAGKPDAALLTLAPLEPYTVNCKRTIDGIHLGTLSAIALYRKKDESWKERLATALSTASDFDFTRTVSVYGAAVLPLLNELSWNGRTSAWRKRLMSAMRAQAAFYPHFLEP